MKIKIGTDCSGIEAPIQALHKLKVDYSHEFSSDIDDYARQSILANYNPKILYDDMTKKRNLPIIDMYICGFPCQPFSMSGEREGSQDKEKGNIFLYCIKTIKQTNPSLFILENVPGIISVEKGAYWKKVTSILAKLDKYSINWSILDTKDYGIPQSRKRLYIVGIKKSRMQKEFKFPKKIKCKPILDFIDKTDKHKDTMESNRIENVNKYKGIFIDLSFFKYINFDSNIDYSPCLNTRNYIWCVPMHRQANIKELSLQGFPKNFKQVVSNFQMKKQIGNSMSVNVLMHLFKECFRSLGWS